MRDKPLEVVSVKVVAVRKCQNPHSVSHGDSGVVDRKPAKGVAFLVRRMVGEIRAWSTY